MTIEIQPTDDVPVPKDLGDEFGATLQEITAISTGYAVALVLVMPLTAFLSRQFGQKNVYMACLGLFLIDRVGPLRRAVMREGVAPRSAQPRLMRGEAL